MKSIVCIVSSTYRSQSGLYLSIVLILSVLVSVAFAEGGHESGHGQMTTYPDPANLPREEGAEQSYNGFGRLFQLKVNSQDEDGFLPHASPRYDLLRLGRKMIATNTAPSQDSEMPVGYVITGQLIDHDITLDVVSGFNELAQDRDLSNTRTVDLDLDCVYGSGPEATPFLYNLPYLQTGAVLVKKGDEGIRYDLFRAKNAKNTALIGDPRNDENFIVSQLQAAFIAYHNRMVDRIVEARIRATNGDAEIDKEDLQSYQEHASFSDKKEIFEKARDHVIHYYHRLIIEDFLPRIIGIERARDMITHGRDFYFPNGFVNTQGESAEPFIPIEFATAGYRFGHSQVAKTYNLRNGENGVIQADLFAIPDTAATATMLVPKGFTPIRTESQNLVFEWHRMVDILYPGHSDITYAQKIDTTLASPLGILHQVDVIPTDGEGNLAARNLSRGRTYRLPSGQDLAEKILKKLSGRGDDFFKKIYQANDGSSSYDHFILEADDTTTSVLGLNNTPLWYYILQEAKVFGYSFTSTIGYSSDKTVTSRSDKSSAESAGSSGAVVMYTQLIESSDNSKRSKSTEAAAQTLPVGATLGPVGSTIVGETLFGLIDHYREKTGKGLDLNPDSYLQPQPLDYRSDFNSLFAMLEANSSNVTPNLKITPALSSTPVVINGQPFGSRYLLRNFLIDAGVADAFDGAGIIICSGEATSPDADCTP